MTCKDCLHYEVCESYSKRESLATLYCAEECPCFTDKSEWVHLPCKVNSTVYIVSEYRGVIESKVRKIFLGLNGAEMIRHSIMTSRFQIGVKPHSSHVRKPRKHFRKGKISNVRK